MPAVAAQFHRQIAFDDLAVIAVELHLQVGRVQHGSDGLGLVLARQEEAGHIAWIDGFDDDGDAGACCGRAA